MCMKANTYYIYRINSLLETSIDKINDGEIFFYSGLLSSANGEKFFVFGLKNGIWSKTLETFHEIIGDEVFSSKKIEIKLKELTKMYKNSNKLNIKK